MDLYNLINKVNTKMEKWLTKHATKTDSEALGLGRRAAHRMWATTEALVVKASDDASLQHYGGFEYVDKDQRTQIGDYVIYSQSADGNCRVDGCIELFFYSEKEEA
jgi:hypothetical protein